MVEQIEIESAFLLDCRFNETEFEVLVDVGEVAIVYECHQLGSTKRDVSFQLSLRMDLVGNLGGKKGSD